MDDSYMAGLGSWVEGDSDGWLACVEHEEASSWSSPKVVDTEMNTD